MSNNDLAYLIALVNIPGIGDINARKLIEKTGSAEAVLNEPYANLLKIQGIGPGLARAIKDSANIDRAFDETEFIKKNHIKTAFFKEKNYPSRLRECPDSPTLLYYKGDIHPGADKIISVVGTRNITSKGKEICRSIIKELACRFPGLIVVSGLAYGVDICAHRSALENKLPTLGIMAHGFKTLYPSAHNKVARQMMDRGALVTDFLSDEPPDRKNFLKRNRIIAGLADATLVIESGPKGGAIVTADIAASYNRDVFAVPGPPGTLYSSGCNLLIKSQKATLIESAGDIEFFMNWLPEKMNIKTKEEKLRMLSPLEEDILKYMTDYQCLPSDKLGALMNKPVQHLATALLSLEFQGLIESVPGNIYRIKTDHFTVAKNPDKYH